MLSANLMDINRQQSPSPTRPIDLNIKPNPQAQAQSQNMSNHAENTYMIKRNADNMLRQNHTSGLHELVLE